MADGRQQRFGTTGLTPDPRPQLDTTPMRESCSSRFPSPRAPKAGETTPDSAAAAASPVVVEAVSFLGDSLRAIPLSDSTRAAMESQLAAAEASLDKAPTNADSIIWVARRLGYLGRFRESIAMYTKGIEQHPDNPWMYRHRGHRYISVRELDNAIADLEKATQLVGREA